MDKWELLNAVDLRRECLAALKVESQERAKFDYAQLPAREWVQLVRRLRSACALLEQRAAAVEILLEDPDLLLFEVVLGAGDDDEIELRIRETAHGPLISDVSAELSTVGANAPVGDDAPQ